MASVRVILGPPGTGKTTAILNEIELLLSAGVRSDDISFVSFTKAACREAKERAAARFGLDPEEDFPNFRTIHSQARKFIERIDVMKGSDWKAFGERQRYEFSDGLDPDNGMSMVIRTNGDQLRQVYDIKRLMMCSFAEALLHTRAAGIISPAVVEEFAKRLTEFKREVRKIDFTDMLRMALRNGGQPGVRFAFVDEAQDNSALQAALVWHWFAKNPTCETVTFAGDDDQAIYTFAGADPSHLIQLANTHGHRTLDQSYRIPLNVHRLAQNIIGQNHRRIAKDYRPRSAMGELTFTSSDRAIATALESDGHIMALVRNAYLAEGASDECKRLGLYYTAETGARCPLDHVATREGALAIAALVRGRPANPSHFARLMPLLPKKLPDGVVVRPHGTVKKAEENETIVTPDRVRHEFKMGYWLDWAMRADNPFETMVKLDADDRDYIGRVMGRDPDLLEGPRVTLTTGHKSKGRESETVILYSDMASASHRELVDGDRESEFRVAYVQATRCKERLIIARPNTSRHFNYMAYR